MRPRVKQQLGAFSLAYDSKENVFGFNLSTTPLAYLDPCEEQDAPSLFCRTVEHRAEHSLPTHGNAVLRFPPAQHIFNDKEDPWR